MAINVESSQTCIGTSDQEPTPPIAENPAPSEIAWSIFLANAYVNNLSMEERSIMNPRYGGLIESINLLPGTPSWRESVKNRVRNSYPAGENDEHKIDLETFLGIDVKNQKYGACTVEGARELELKEFVNNVHGSIQDYISLGRVGEAEKAFRKYSTWTQEFSKVYGKEPFSD